MTALNLALNTDAANTSQGFPYWRDAMAGYFGLQACCAPHHEAKFKARLTQYAIGRMLLREVAGSPHTVMRTSAAADCRLVVQLQLKGWSLIRQNEQEIELSSGQIGLFCNSRPVCIERTGCFQSISLCIGEDSFADAMPHWRHGAVTRIPGGDGAAAIFSDTLTSLFRQAGKLDAASLEVIADATLNLLAAALRPYTDSPPRNPSRLDLYHRERIKKCILLHLHDPNLDVKSIAQAVGLSSRYVHQLFSSEPLRLMQWVQTQRLERCRQALSLDPFRTISEVAYSWGFNDPAHFSKVFRKYFGTGPSEMQRQGRLAHSLKSSQDLSRTDI